MKHDIVEPQSTKSERVAIKFVGLVLLLSLAITSLVSCASGTDSPIKEETEDDFFMRPTEEILVTATPVPTYVKEAEDCELVRGTSCQNVDLSGLDLGKVQAHYSKKGRESVDLRDADFTGAIAIGTNFEQARLDGIVFHNANLEGANMLSASAYQADFTGANLTGVVLMYADIEEGIFDGANLTNANLGTAILNSASLRNANLTGADLTSADLEGADLEGAILLGTIFCVTIMPDGSRNDTGCPD